MCTITSGVARQLAKVSPDSVSREPASHATILLGWGCVIRACQGAWMGWGDCGEDAGDAFKVKFCIASTARLTNKGRGSLLPSIHVVYATFDFARYFLAYHTSDLKVPKSKQRSGTPVSVVRRSARPPDDRHRTLLHQAS